MINYIEPNCKGNTHVFVFTKTASTSNDLYIPKGTLCQCEATRYMEYAEHCGVLSIEES